MTRISPLVRALVFASMIGSAAAALAAQAPAPSATPAPLTAADAKPLVGDWTIATDGPAGPMTFLLTVKADAAKATAEITSEATGVSPITDITKSGDNVTMRYAFDYQGNPVSAELTLTPAGETLKAYFDFAGGAFTMPGVATRKKAQ